MKLTYAPRELTHVNRAQADERCLLRRRYPRYLADIHTGIGAGACQDRQAGAALRIPKTQCFTGAAAGDLLAVGADANRPD